MILETGSFAGLRRRARQVRTVDQFEKQRQAERGQIQGSSERFDNGETKYTSFEHRGRK